MLRVESKTKNGEDSKATKRSGISVQTSVEDEAGITRGHTSIETVADSDTAKAALQRTGATVYEDLDQKSAVCINAEVKELLRSPVQATAGSNSSNKTESRKIPSKEGLKTKAGSKIAVEICNRIEIKSRLKEEEGNRLD